VVTQLPLIVDVKRHSLEDGPGIRSVVFFKGCPLSCSFCHNPETQESLVEIAFYPDYCIDCGLCETVCEHNAIRADRVNRIDREHCLFCGDCTEICPSQALQMVGRFYPVEDLLELILRDRGFYRHSGGGVTLSGGECTLYPDYVEVLLKALKSHNIHVMIETSGYFDYQATQRKVLPYVDLLYVDIKFADSEMHKRFTGKDNRVILDNIERLMQNGKIPAVFRIPLIPEVTATRRNLFDIADFLTEVNVTEAVLLPYNPLGLEKWPRIGKSKPDLPEQLMSEEEIEKLNGLFSSRLKRPVFK
jgi:pyruvate formate lyase activating enzyme